MFIFGGTGPLTSALSSESKAAAETGASDSDGLTRTILGIQQRLMAHLINFYNNTDNNSNNRPAIEPNLAPIQLQQGQEQRNNAELDDLPPRPHRNPSRRSADPAVVEPPPLLAVVEEHHEEESVAAAAAAEQPNDADGDEDNDGDIMQGGDANRNENANDGDDMSIDFNDDSNSDDLINEETEDEDPASPLVSLSDLHVLHLDGTYLFQIIARKVITYI